MTAPPQSSSRPRMIWRETEQMGATLKPWGPSQWGVRHRSVITAVAVRGVALQRAVRRVVDMQTWAPGDDPRLNVAAFRTLLRRPACWPAER